MHNTHIFCYAVCIIYNLLGYPVVCILHISFANLSVHYYYTYLFCYPECCVFLHKMHVIYILKLKLKKNRMCIVHKKASKYTFNCNFKVNNQSICYICVLFTTNYGKTWLQKTQQAQFTVNTPGVVESQGKFKQKSYVYYTNLVWENHIIARNWWPQRITKTLMFVITQYALYSGS